MKKLSNIWKLLVLGIALYVTISPVLAEGIIALCKAAYPRETDGAVLIKNLFDSILNQDAATIRLMLTIIVISIRWDFKRPIQVLFDILISWLAILLWGWLCDGLVVSKAWSGIICRETFVLLITAIFAALFDARIGLTIKGRKPGQKAKRRGLFKRQNEE